MIDPSLELQGAIVSRLLADASVSAMVGTRVYDAVPECAVTPYVSFGPDQIIEADAEGIIGSEVYIQIDCWSTATGKVEVKKLANAVRRALDDADLTISENALVSFEFRNRRVLSAPDGVTSHAPVTFRAIVEQGA